MTPRGTSSEKSKASESSGCQGSLLHRETNKLEESDDQKQQLEFSISTILAVSQHPRPNNPEKSLNDKSYILISPYSLET